MRRLTRRQRIGAAVLAVLALLFISLDFAGGSFAGSRHGVTGALGSLYRGTDSVLGPSRRFIQGIPDVGSNRDRIAALEQQNNQLRRSLTATQLDTATAAELKKLKLQAATESWTVMPARVLATGPGAGFQWTVTVDVGSADGVAAGQTVTDGVALVGRVLTVYPSTSVVLLAADPDSSVGVRDERTGQLLLATGAGAHGLTGSPLDGTVAVKAGDTLVSGPAGRTTYAAGLPTGTVTAVHTAADGTFAVSIRPAAAQTGLDLLGIVLAGPNSGTRVPIAGASG